MSYKLGAWMCGRSPLSSKLRPGGILKLSFFRHSKCRLEHGGSHSNSRCLAQDAARKVLVLRSKDQGFGRSWVRSDHRVAPCVIPKGKYLVTGATWRLLGTQAGASLLLCVLPFGRRCLSRRDAFFRVLARWRSTAIACKSDCLKAS